MAKKTNTKKVSKKEVDINDIDSMVEDMKELALTKPKKTKKAKVKSEKKDENVIVNETKPDEKVTLVEEEQDKQEAKEEVLEDLKFIEEIKEEAITEEEQEICNKQKALKKKMKKMSYYDMFAPTWMGYGYTE